MGLENIETRHYKEALNSIKKCLTLSELEHIEFGYYFPESIQNDYIVITDFIIENLEDLEDYTDSKPQTAFIFVGNGYGIQYLECGKMFYFITYEDFRKLCRQALAYFTDVIIDEVFLGGV